ncbi:MAG: hypothetical protein JXR68_07245 [Bacteroidales bacterium]|nr:hypothetical protein [Bacteroidales bacterium]
MKNRFVKILFFSVLILITTYTFANVGGATLKPGLIGDPIVWQLTNISIIKENLNLKFYEKDNKKYCSFTAIYYMNCDTNQMFSVNGIFYGLRAENIQIYFNDLIVNEQIDSSNFKQIDDLIYYETRKREINTVWADWSNLNKVGFKFNYLPNEQNVLKVTGEISLEPTQIWYGMATAAIYAKHPFLNKQISKDDEIFYYLITPIETWKSVGEIEITAEYPADWSISYNEFSANLSNKETDNNITKEQFLFKDTIPSIFTMIFQKQKQYFYFGGGNIGFHKIGKEDFTTRIGWEFGIYHSFLINTIIAFDYETDFSNYHQFCITVLPSTPWLGLFWPSLGARVGLPVYFVNNNIYTGIRLRTDFSWGLFNISLNWDFIPKLNIEFQNINYYGISF